MQTDSVLDAIKWFKANYKNNAFTLRKFQAECIIDGEKRYKVIDIYHQKVDGFYFIVYKKNPIRESFRNSAYSNINGSPFDEYGIYL